MLSLFLVIGLTWRFSGVHPEYATKLQNFGYYEILTLTCIVTLISAIRMASKSRWIERLWNSRREVLGVLAATAAVLALWCAHEPRMARVCHDEPQHIATAMVMHESGKVGQPVATLGEADNISPILIVPVYRGVLYPYLISLSHDVLGYSETHAYSVNLTLGASVLLLAYFIGRNLTMDARLGWLSFLLMVSVPLLGQIARSASYDLLNTFLLLAFLSALHHAWSNPNKEELSFAAGIGILLALTRAESVVYLGLFALLILCAAWRKKSMPPMSRLLWPMLPAVYAALSTQVLLVQSYADVSDSVNTTSKPNFAWSNLIRHGEDAIAYLYAPDIATGASPWLAWIGTVAALILAAKLITRKLQIQFEHTLLFISGGIILCFYCITLATFWGGPNQAEMARFTLPIWGWLICSVALFLKSCPNLSKTMRLLMIATSLALFLETLPSLKTHKATKEMCSGWINLAMERLGERIETPGTLFITKSSLTYAGKRFSSCIGGLCEKSPEKISLLKRYGLIRRVVFCAQQSSDPHMDKLAAMAYGRMDASRWKLIPITAEPIPTLPTCQVVAYEVLAIKNLKGEWISLDGPRLDLPHFKSEAEYENFLASLMP